LLLTIPGDGLTATKIELSKRFGKFKGGLRIVCVLQKTPVALLACGWLLRPASSQILQPVVYERYEVGFVVVGLDADPAWSPADSAA
jgi:hypothetical protein